MKPNLFESDFQCVVLHQIIVAEQVDQLLLGATVGAGQQQRQRAGQADGRVEEVAVLVAGPVVGLEKVQREIVHGDLKVAFGVHLAHYRPE